MSIENVADGAKPSPTDDGQRVKDAEAVLAKNQELLGKLKSQTDKMKAMEEELGSLKNAKLTQEGKKDELIESLKDQLASVKQKESDLGWKIVSSQVGIEAAKRGCVNPEALMKLVDFGSVGVNADSFSIASDDVNLILDKAMKDHSYLFKPTKTGPKDGGISSGFNSDGGKSFKDMSTKELLEAYKKISIKK